MSRRKAFEQTLGSSDLPVKWLKFYTLWMLPISIVLSVISIIIGIVANGKYGIDIPLWRYLFSVASIVLTLVLYLQLIRLTPLGYKLMMIYLLISPVSRVINLILNYSPRNVGILLLNAVFVGASYVYFKKRKHLFESPTSNQVDL